MRSKICSNAVLAILLLLATILLCSGCQREKEVISLGAALPMTGGVSYYGQDSKLGIDLAVDEINTSGGINGVPLKIIYEDTQGQGKQAVNAVRKLIDIDKVPAIIGCGTSTETMAVAPIVEQAQRVLLSPVSSAAAISHAGEFIFRSVPSDSQEARELSQWVLDTGHRRIVVLYVNQTWGVGLKDDFIREFELRKGEVLAVQASDIDEKNFRTQLTSLRAYDPDAFVAIIYAKEGGQLLKQAQELGIKKPFFGADPWMKHQFADAAGSAANGVQFTTPAKYEGTEFQDFSANFVKRYGHTPGIYESHGYDCVRLLAQAMKSGARTGPEIQQKLAQIKAFKGATGETTFDVNGDVLSKGFARLTWHDGAIKPADLK
jgi:branched-chain amino acid transport system substrate-binding protein